MGIETDLEVIAMLERLQMDWGEQLWSRRKYLHDVMRQQHNRTRQTAKIVRAALKNLRLSRRRRK